MNESESVLLSGDLAEINLPTLLMSLYRERETGILMIHSIPYTKALFIKEGNVVFLTSDDPDDRLGECLLRKGVISVRQYLKSSRQLGPRKKMGEILVDMGVITPDDLVEGVSQQLTEIFDSIIPLRGGSYTLHLQEFTTMDLITFSMELPSLLYTSMQKNKKWSQIYASVGNPSSRLRLVSPPPPFCTQMEISPDHEHLLSLCRNGIPISALLDASYLNSFETYRTLWIFLILGLVEREDKARKEEAEWNAEPYIEQRNDIFLYAFHMLGDVGPTVFRNALDMARIAHPGMVEHQEGFSSFGKLDVDRLLVVHRGLPEPERRDALRSFLDEVLYALLFNTEKHASHEAAEGLRQYIETHGNSH
ncbi:MAG: DUF4388 domain-containing protein [Acidobacteriota bacterium]|jgi:hypothetical protein